MEVLVISQNFGWANFPPSPFQFHQMNWLLVGRETPIVRDMAILSDQTANVIDLGWSPLERDTRHIDCAGRFQARSRTR